MKKVGLLLVLLTLYLPVRGQAVYALNEYSFEYGQFTVPQGTYLLGGVFEAVFSLGHFTFDHTFMTGSVGFGYERNVGEVFSFGGTVLGEYMTANAYSVSGDGEKTPTGKFNLGAVSVIPNIKLHWFRHVRFNMYSKLGAGVSTIISSEVNVIPAVQVSPVCMEFGIGPLTGFLELGAGTQGIVTAGIIWHSFGIDYD